jgi:ribonuclease HI
VRLVIHVDGGARGNPGPAAIGVVVSKPDGAVLEEFGEQIGRATNNVAEYRALLRGVSLARELGAREVEIIGDSELIARQLTGDYKVKHPSMKPLYEEAISALGAFDRWQIRTVPRARNARADELVNEALDGAG